MQYRQADYHPGYEQVRDHQRLIREVRAQERLARQAQHAASRPTQEPAWPRRVGDLIWALMRYGARATSTT